MSALFPKPSPSPLKRLVVEDGLLLNTERWQVAHTYHQHRQNLHYQSLNQPGIVCGLGVTVIPAPDQISAKYRDNRWIEIKSGIAIDLVGNLIIVPEPLQFHIASEASDEPTWVYIVIRYVDPEKLHHTERTYIVQETFRIDEKTTPPTELEVELCRVLLLPTSSNISTPANVFFPEGNQLDFRYRQSVRARPQGVVRVAAISQGSPVNTRILCALSGLLNSLAALYPAMRGVEEVGQVQLQGGAESQPLDCDLLYLSYQQFSALTEAEVEILKQYALEGGVLLVEVSDRSAIDAFTNQEQTPGKVGTQADKINSWMGVNSGHQFNLPLTNALTANPEPLVVGIQKIWQSSEEITVTSGAISGQHPLRNQPFLFGQWPVIANQAIEVFNWGAIVFIIGNLSVAWSLDERINLPRETIRTSQEMGINILQFAWNRRRFTQF
jgi:hypothetical protein